MIVLDSTFLIQLIRRSQVALKYLKQLKPLTILATTRINEFEIFTGYYANKAYKINPEWRTRTYSRIVAILTKVIILELEEKEVRIAAQLNAQLMRQREEIGDKDAMIAGIMQINGIKYIVTDNIDHFKRIQGILPLNYLEPLPNELKI